MKEIFEKKIIKAFYWTWLYREKNVWRNFLKRSSRTNSLSNGICIGFE